MENSTFKSVAFGGFDKQDVISYIEKTAGEAAALQEELQQENEKLKKDLDTLSVQLGQLQAQTEALRSERDSLQENYAQEQARCRTLEENQKDTDSLRAEVTRLRPDAEAYAQFREGIGAIECEARKRAADLESDTISRLNRTVSAFRAQYQELMSAFDATSSHVTGELRRIEVTLTQLPRAMDQVGTELNTLSAVLNGQEET